MPGALAQARRSVYLKRNDCKFFNRIYEYFILVFIDFEVVILLVEMSRI